MAAEEARAEAAEEARAAGVAAEEALPRYRAGCPPWLRRLFEAGLMPKGKGKSDNLKKGKGDDTPSDYRRRAREEGQGLMPEGSRHAERLQMRPSQSPAPAPTTRSRDRSRSRDRARSRAPQSSTAVETGPAVEAQRCYYAKTYHYAEGSCEGQGVRWIRMIGRSARPKRRFICQSCGDWIVQSQLGVSEEML